MKQYFQCAFLAAAMIAVPCGKAQAVLLWYDGFTTTDQGGDYEIGEPLAGQSGGTGSFFTGPWMTQGEDNVVIGDSLTRPGQIQPSTGGAASVDSPEFCCTMARTSRMMDVPWSGFTKPEGTFYVGFHIDFGVGVFDDPHHRVFEMHFDGFDDDPHRSLMLGVSNFALQDDLLALWVRGAATTPLIVDGETVDLLDLSVQGTHHMVLRFDLSHTEDDVISAWLDPVGTVESAPHAQIAVDEFLADRMSAFVQFVFNAGGPGVAGTIDEFRVGTEFADVANNTLAYVGIPEPSTLSLVVFGLLSMLMGARRRRG